PAGFGAAGAREPPGGADPAGYGTHAEGEYDRRGDDPDGTRPGLPLPPPGRRPGGGEQQQAESGGGRGEDPDGQQVVGERGGDGEHGQKQHAGRGRRPRTDGDR